MADSIPAVRRERTSAPVHVRLFGDRIFNTATFILALAILALLLGLAVALIATSFPAIRTFGLHFFISSEWDPVNDKYGALPFIYGTFISSFIALAIAVPLSLGVALCLSEMAPDWLSHRLGFLVDLLAAIPSVVYGLWGLFVVIPLIRPMCNWLHVKLGWIPLFSTDLSGPGVLPAVIVLSIMILPTITAISRDALVSVPSKLRMAAYGLGATRWEALLAVILPTALRGIMGGVVLAFGRALGETMALAMLVGNSNQISASLFSPANTLAALLANNFPEAGARQVGVLMYAALVLLGITLIVNILGAAIIQRASVARVD
jgi:phosphate transport system permease protein